MKFLKKIAILFAICFAVAMVFNFIDHGSIFPKPITIKQL